MTLKTSFFDRTIFTKTVKRFWPLWVGYLAIWLLILPISLHENYRWNETVTVAQVQRYIFDFCTGASVATFLMAPVSAMAVFSHLYNDRSCGAYACMPLKRETTYTSVMLAGLVPLLVATFVTFLATMWAEFALGVVEWRAALSWLAVTAMDTVTFYGFAVLCAQLTGNTLIAPALYVVLSFTAIVVNLILAAIFELFLYGYSSYDTTFAMYLTPVVKLWEESQYVQHEVMTTAEGYTKAISHRFDGWDTVIAYCISGLAFLAVSLLLYRTRRMESAGDVVAMKKLRPVFKYALAAGCALVLGIAATGLFYNDVYATVMGIPIAGGMCLCMLAGGFVGYFGAEMLNRKNFRVFDSKSTWIGFACFAVAVSIGIGVLAFDLTGFERRTPRAENIQSATIHYAGYNVIFEGAEVEELIALHEKILATNNAATPLDDDWDGSRWFSLHYITKRGRLIQREYQVPLCNKTKDFYRAAEDLFNSPAARKERGFGDKNLTPAWFEYCEISYYKDDNHQTIALTKEEAYEFYRTCIEPDLTDGTLERCWILEDSPYRTTEYNNVHINMNIRSPYLNEDGHYGDSDYLYLAPTTESARVNAWLTARGVELSIRDLESGKKIYKDLGTITSFPEMSSIELTAEVAKELAAGSF